MNNKKFILQEEIKRMRELSTYDKSKTLNEQGSADINMDRVNQQQLAQAPEVKTIVSPQTDIKTKKFPCFTSTSVPYDYNPKRGDTVGNYAPAKMDFLRMFQDNSIIVAWENGTIKQYVRNGNSAGAETKKGTWKCKSNNSGVDVVWANNTPEQPKTEQAKKPPLKAAGQSTPNTKESSIGITYQYDYPKDKNYTYGVKDKKWFGKKLDNGKEFDLSTFTTTIANLNRQFPNALTQQEPSAPAAPALAAAAPAAAPTATTPITPKKLTDMVKIELDNMKKNQPLAFNSAYNKLGAIEKAQVDKTYANK